jgi:hypothetical protein
MPIGPTLPASPAESMPAPEIVNLNRWAVSVDSEWDDSSQT